jgi:hypothetical protein
VGNNKPTVKLIGENGNVFNLIGIASKALKGAGLKEQANEMHTRIMREAESYDHALVIIMEYVNPV